MQHEVRYKDVAKDRARELLDELVARHLEKHLQAFEADQVRLHTSVESEGGDHRVSTRLAVPGGTLATRGHDPDLRVAAQAAFEHLERRLKRYRERLRRDDEWKRPARRGRLRRLKRALAERTREQRELYRALVRDGLEGATRAVRRELAYLRAAGDLPLDYPAVGDVMDEVLVRALGALPADPETIDVRAELNRLGMDVLAEEIAKARRESRESSLDDARLAHTPERDDELEEWEKPEAFRIENLVATPEASDPPSREAEAEQLRRTLAGLLRSLPVHWRRALMLHHVDEMPIDAVAAALGRDRGSIVEDLAHANAFLREKLRESGVSLTVPDQPADSLAARPLDAGDAAGVGNELDDMLGSFEDAS